MNLDDPKVVNTPIIKPVHDMLTDAVKGATNVTLKGEDTVLGHAVYVLDITAPSGAHQVSVDKVTFDVLKWKSPQDERTFYDIKANVSPRINC